MNGAPVYATPRRTVRVPERLRDGRSVYRVEVREPAPTFSKGDGRDGGRNLLSAVLIGPRWVGIGYVAGRRGEWSAYRDWPEPRGRKGTRYYRPAAEPVTAGLRTVDAAARALATEVRP